MKKISKVNIQTALEKVYGIDPCSRYTTVGIATCPPLRHRYSVPTAWFGEMSSALPSVSIDLVVDIIRSEDEQQPKAKVMWPYYRDLMLASGFIMTDFSAKGGTYIPISDSKSISLRFINDKKVLVATGMRADMTLFYEVGRVATASFALIGKDTFILDNAPTDTPIIEVSPAPLMDVFITLGGLLFTVTHLEIRLGNTVDVYRPRDDYSQPVVNITDRRTTGSISVLMPTEYGKRLVELAMTGNRLVELAMTGKRNRIDIVFGYVDNEWFKVVIPYAHLDMPEIIGYRDEGRTMECGFKFNCDSLKGDAALRIIW